MGVFRNTKTGDVVEVPPALDEKYKARDDMEPYKPKSSGSKPTTQDKA